MAKNNSRKERKFRVNLCGQYRNGSVIITARSVPKAFDKGLYLILQEMNEGKRQMLDGLPLCMQAFDYSTRSGYIGLTEYHAKRIGLEYEPAENGGGPVKATIAKQSAHR